MRGWLVVCLAGCNQFYGLDQTRLDVDARPIDGPGCSDGVFRGPEVFADPIGDVEIEPQLRHDLREIWFVILGAGANTLWVATRAESSGPFGLATEAPFRGSATDQSPALSGDGLRMLFLSNRSGSMTIWETTRASIEDPFPATATILSGLGDYAIESFDVSFDGNTIYFVDLFQSSAIYEATRPAFDQPFGPARLVASPARSPSVSPDGLELFYNERPGGNVLFRQTRASTTVPFGTPERVTDVGEGPDIAANGMTLIIGLGSAVSVLERTCQRDGT